MEIEIDGFDESGNIGTDLRFVRVGMDISCILKPYLYNILHFNNISVSKNYLNSLGKDQKMRYVKTVLADPTFDVDCYYFATEEQIKVLRHFTMLEQSRLNKQRKELLKEHKKGKETKKLVEHIEYLKRYESSPYWMESYVKAYGFRMAVADMQHTSRTLTDSKIKDYRVFSYVDGGYPFVFWWNQFLNELDESSRFHLNKTPVFGITNGDEYYPQVGMAGNIAYITSQEPSMLFPHNIRQLNVLPPKKLEQFYELFSDKRGTPSHHNRLLFFGRLPREFQHLLPFILNQTTSKHDIFEPFNLRYDRKGTVAKFEEHFGELGRNDVVVHGVIKSKRDRNIMREFKDKGIKVQDAGKYIKDFCTYLDKLKSEAECSNLSRSQKNKIYRYLEKARKTTEKKLK